MVQYHFSPTAESCPAIRVDWCPFVVPCPATKTEGRGVQKSNVVHQRFTNPKTDRPVSFGFAVRHEVLTVTNAYERLLTVVLFSGVRRQLLPIGPPQQPLNHQPTILSTIPGSLQVIPGEYHLLQPQLFPPCQSLQTLPLQGTNACAARIESWPCRKQLTTNE